MILSNCPSSYSANAPKEKTFHTRWALNQLNKTALKTGSSRNPYDRSNNDNSLKIGLWKSFQPCSAPSSGWQTASFHYGYRLLVFKVTPELEIKRWEWGKLKLHCSYQFFILRFSHFSWINDAPQIVSSFSHHFERVNSGHFANVLIVFMAERISKGFYSIIFTEVQPRFILYQRFFALFDSLSFLAALFLFLSILVSSLPTFNQNKYIYIILHIYIYLGADLKSSKYSLLRGFIISPPDYYNSVQIGPFAACFILF